MTDIERLEKKRDYALDRLRTLRERRATWADALHALEDLSASSRAIINGRIRQVNALIEHHEETLVRISRLEEC